MNVTVFVDLGGDALQLVLLSRGADDFFIEDSGSRIRSKFHRPIFACFVQSKILLSLVSFPFLWSEMICMVFLCNFVHLFALLFCPSGCELWFTVNWISEKSIVNTCKMFTLTVDVLTASLPRIPRLMVLFLYFGFYHAEHHDCVLSLSRSSG